MSEEGDDFKAEIRQDIRANEEWCRDHEALMDTLLKSQLRLEQSRLRSEEDSRIFKRFMTKVAIKQRRAIRRLRKAVSARRSLNSIGISQ